MHLHHKSNEYVETVGLAFIDQIPKAVLAAIAISALTCGGDTLGTGDGLAVRQALVKEWYLLHANEIVPQAIPAGLRPYLAKDVEISLA